MSAEMLKVSGLQMRFGGLLAVDGVTPSNETIADQSYPLCNEFYAAILQDSAADSPERRIYEWLSTDAGRSCIEHSGYVAVQ